MKVKTKSIIVLMIVLFAVLLLGTTKVSANIEITSDKFTSTDFILEDKFNLVQEKPTLINNNGVVSVCYSWSKIYDCMVNNESLIRQNAEEDNWVYDYLYIKVHDATAKAKLDTSEILEIVEINNEKYFKCPVPVFMIVNNEIKYFGSSAPSIWFEDENGNTVAMQNGYFSIGGGSPFQVWADYNWEDVGSGLILFASNTYDRTADELIEEECKKISADSYAGTITIDRNYAKGNCYMVLYSTIYAGNTINVQSFGTLSYVGKQGSHFQYVAQITDKSIFNKGEINLDINEENFHTSFVWLFEGDLVDLTTTVTKEDTTTGIKLETTTTVLPSNVILSSVTVTEQSTLDTVNKALKDTTSKYKVYDINLLKDGEKVQPNGQVKISIPIPSDYDKSRLEIYRIDDNGTKTKYDVTVDGEYATFETDHFSTYVLAEKQEETTPTNNDKKELDETPKTGATEIAYYVLPVAIISAIGIVVFRKKNNK